MDFKSSFFNVLWHMQLNMSYYIIMIFRLYLYIFKVFCIFIKYSCTKIFYRRSLYTFFSNDMVVREYRLLIYSCLSRRRLETTCAGFIVFINVKMHSYNYRKNPTSQFITCWGCCTSKEYLCIKTNKSGIFMFRKTFYEQKLAQDIYVDISSKERNDGLRWAPI